MTVERTGRLPVSVSVAVYIEDEQKRLLLVQQSKGDGKGQWGPPAGGLEPHENPISAGKREVREEIGITPELKGLIGVYTVDRGDQTTGVGFAFTGELLDNNFILQEDEIADARYFTSEEVTQLIEEELIYKPAYTNGVLADRQKGVIFSLDMFKPLRSKKK